MSTTLIGTLVEIRDTFLVLDGNTHVMLPLARPVRVRGNRALLRLVARRAEGIEPARAASRRATHPLRAMLGASA